jgi:glycerol uptake facilitator-like aquaporin
MSNEAEHLLNKKPDEETGINNNSKGQISVNDPYEFSNVLKAAIFEMAAMFMFVNVIYFCQADVGKFIFGMWVILVLFGQFSGAHVNPAVTLGFYCYEGEYRKGLVKLLLYWLFQFAGAAIGAAISREFYKKLIFVSVPTNRGIAEVMFSEFVFTGTFIFVILFVCSLITRPTKNSGWNCAVIVGWFYTIVQAGAHISGAAYNPAVLTILNLFAYESTESKALHYIVLMIVAQLLGVISHAYIFKYGFEKYIKNKMEGKKI